MDPVTLTQLPVTAFLDRLAATQPTPGGGSVAALSGALAAALGEMVAGYTVGRPKLAAVEPEMQAILAACHTARQHLVELVEEDAAAYALLSAALKRDKADPQRAAAVAEAAWVAASVPLATARLARGLHPRLCRLHDAGNPNLRSDAAGAVQLAQTAIQLALANVKANLPLVSAERARDLEGELAQFQ